MKNATLFLLSCIWVLSNALAQNLPNGATTIPGSVQTYALPQAFPSTGPKNYVRTWIPTIPITNSNGIDENTISAEMTTTYISGLGTNIQSVVKSGSPSGEDLIMPLDTRPNTYNLQFLPYSSGSNGGKFRSNAFSDQSYYYNSLYPAEGGISYGVSKEYYNNGARGTFVGRPGKSQTGQNRGTLILPSTNAANDVRIWSIDVTTGLPAYTGYYAANQLSYVSKVISSSNTTSKFLEEYKDKEGKLICRRIVQKDLGNGNFVKNTTYYIYDDFGRVIYILSPRAVEVLESGQAMTQTTAQTLIDNLCTSFKYDKFNRVVEKRVPGESGPECIVYDIKGRVVLTQSPKLRSEGKWAFTLYDDLSRPVMYGHSYTGSTSRQSWQTLIDNQVLPWAPNLSSKLEYYVVGGRDASSYPTLINGVTLKYSYYDNYTNPISQGVSFSMTHYYGELSTASGSISPFRSLRNNGRLTAEKIKVIKDPNNTSLDEWVYNVYFYDERGDLLQKFCKNQTSINSSVWDVQSYQYDFNGRVLREIVKHNNPLSTTKPLTLTFNKYEYYASSKYLNRILSRIDSEPWKEIVSYSYNGLGDISRKKIGEIETQDFSYNIRGEQTGINKVYAETGTAPSGSLVTFGESISYDYGFSSPTYDGNIAGILWKGAGSSSKKSYGYTYNSSGQLNHAEFREWSTPTGGSTNSWNKSALDYTMSNMDYDANGNILSLDREASIPGLSAPVTVDRLTYHYENSEVSNRIDYVNDAITQNYGLGDFQDGASGTTDFSYDDAGNLTKDENKNIAIEYNFLDKPSKITFGSNDYIEFSYDALGQKLQERISSNGVTTTRDYVGVHVYNNNVLQLITIPEGRIRVTNTGGTFSYNYDFFVCDHLKNVRNILTSELSPLEDYLANHEIASANLENLYFDGIDEVRDDKPDATDAGDLKAALLNAGNPEARVGTSLLLHVMAGDKFEVSAESYTSEYNADHDTPIDDNTMMESIISTLAVGHGGFEGGETGESGIIQDIFNVENYVDAFQGSIVNNITNQDAPRAFLNYIVFDENMKIIEEQSGAIQVQATGEWDVMSALPITIAQNGYLTVFISNKSTHDVYFDKIRLQFWKGRLIEENHYYPYGLAVNIGDNNPLKNKYLYQTKSRLDDLGVLWEDFHSRQYDPQLGRFHSVDPAGQFYSGYVGMGNNPNIHMDPDGKWVQYVVGAVVGGCINLAVNWNSATSVGKGVGFFFAGAANGALVATGNPAMMGLGGSIQSAANTALMGGNVGQTAISAAIGFGSGYIMGGVSNYITPLNPGQYLTSNALWQPVLTGAISLGAGSAVGGGFAGYVGSNGDWTAGMKAALHGAVIGSIMGGATSFASTFVALKKMDRNPWTGQPNTVLTPIQTKGVSNIEIETQPPTLLAQEKIDNLVWEIHAGKQGKHIEGHNNYIDGNGILTENPAILLEGIQTGNFPILRQVGTGNKYIVDFKQDIGVYFKDGVRIGNTQYGIVTFSKTGAHIIPASPVQW